MSIRSTVIRFVSYGAATLWIVVGLITVGSIYFSSIGLVVNMVVGSVFIVIGLFLFLKEKALLELMTDFSIDQNNKLYKKVIAGELVILIMALFVGLVALSAVTSRVFGERLAVFG